MVDILSVEMLFPPLYFCRSKWWKNQFECNLSTARLFVLYSCAFPPSSVFLVHPLTQMLCLWNECCPLYLFLRNYCSSLWHLSIRRKNTDDDKQRHVNPSLFGAISNFSLHPKNHGYKPSGANRTGLPVASALDRFSSVSRRVHSRVGRTRIEPEFRCQITIAWIALPWFFFQ